jgi:hypothetical protein
MAATSWIAAAPLVSIAACANVWGFNDVTVGGDAGRVAEATTNDLGFEGAPERTSDGLPGTLSNDSSVIAEVGVETGTEGSGPATDGSDIDSETDASPGPDADGGPDDAQSCNVDSCSPTPRDGGLCTVLSCSTGANRCIALVQSPCCKTDGTCGCSGNFPRGPCQ